MTAEGTTTAPARRRLTAAVSGSFHCALAEVQSVVAELTERNVRVLSPTDPREVGAFADFIYVASDASRAVKQIQDRHFAAIAASDFLWLCAPDGYLGNSAAAEIHHANLHAVPVFCTSVPTDLYWRQVVVPVPNAESALTWLRESDRTGEARREGGALLLDPDRAAEQLHSAVDVVRHRLTTPGQEVVTDPDLAGALSRIRRLGDLRD